MSTRDEATKRDHAIDLLIELVDPDRTQALTEVKCARVVDALIEAARAPETEHTRAVEKRRRTDAEERAHRDPRV